jgi:diguanylate cyclase (GGDEF)-like protein
MNPRRPASRTPLIALLVLVLFAPCVMALDPIKQFHHYVRDTWSIEQGLPQISALAIAQDNHGYLWVGTQAGLARFDGHRFLAFTAETAPELPGTFINDLLHEHDRLWIATYKGLAVLEQGRIANVPLFADGMQQAPNVVALAQSAAGEILAAAGEAVYAVQDGELLLRHRLPRPAQALLALDDSLLVGTRGGVYRMDPGAAEPAWLPLPAAAGSAVVTHLLQAQGRLWAGSSQGLFHLADGRFRRYAADESLARAPIEALREDRDGNLWVAEIAHLARLRDGLPHERIEMQDAGLSVRAVFEDREGNLWLGSQWNGLTRLRNGWTQRFSLREGLHTRLLWSVAEGEDGRLWVGTDSGLSVFDGDRFEQVVDGAALPHPNAYTLLVEGDTVWIGTRRGLAIYRNGQLLRPAEFDELLTAQINGILRDRSGVLWFATTSGLFRHTEPGLQRYAEAEGLADPRVRYLLQSAAGPLLLGTHSGLFEYRDGRLLARGLDSGLPAGLDVTVIHELPGGRLAIGSLSEDMYLHDGSHWTRFGPAQGMPSNAAFFLAHDDEYLWVGGIRGIQRAPLADMYEVAAGRAERVRGEMLLNERGDRRGGQKGFCCNGAGNAKGLQRDHKLWAPTRDGLVALDTRDVRFPTHAPTTLVERMRIAGDWHDADEMTDASLPAEARDLAFEFTGISFEDPRSVAFRYRLLGYHDDWRLPDEAGQRVVSYTNLPPGAHRFEVQASSVGDIWSEPVGIEFSIRPHFRETVAFYALLGLAALLVAYAGYRVQRRRYARHAQLLEALVQQRTEALAEANQRLQEASHTDPLTGLRNRRYLGMQIPKDLSFYERELRRGTAMGKVIAFAIVDIDHFKRINDVHGHAAGDRVLEQFAEVLLRQVRSGDYVARWGGEEFLLVFRPTPADQLPILGERVRNAVASQPFDIGTAQPLSLTCSIGLIEYPLFSDDGQHVLGWDQLIELADRALYHVKRNGRNGWAAYRPKPGVSVERVLELLRADEAEFAASPELDLIEGHGQRVY